MLTILSLIIFFSTDKTQFFSCYTGLSYIDLYELTSENIKTSFDGHLWVMTKRHKTNIDSNIRLLDVPKAILDKYAGKQKDGKLLPVISNQKMNDYLREIAIVCGIGKCITLHMSDHNKSFFCLKISDLQIISPASNDMKTSDLRLFTYSCITFKEPLTWCKNTNKF